MTVCGPHVYVMAVSVERFMIYVERFYTNAAVGKNKVFAKQVAARKKICAWCYHCVVVGDPTIVGKWDNVVETQR
jgi:hypothetical protein